VKSNKIANNSATTGAREKISTYLKSMFRTKFANYQILLNKIIIIFLVTAKLFTGWQSLIN